MRSIGLEPQGRRPIRTDFYVLLDKSQIYQRLSTSKTSMGSLVFRLRMPLAIYFGIPRPPVVNEHKQPTCGLSRRMSIICGRNLDLRNLEQIPELFLVMVGDLPVGEENYDNEPAPTKAELSVMVSLGFDRGPGCCVGERGIVEHTVIVKLIHCVVLIAQLNGRAA